MQKSTTTDEIRVAEVNDNNLPLSVVDFPETWSVGWMANAGEPVGKLTTLLLTQKQNLDYPTLLLGLRSLLLYILINLVAVSLSIELPFLACHFLGWRLISRGLHELIERI